MPLDAAPDPRRRPGGMPPGHTIHPTPDSPRAAVPPARAASPECAWLALRHDYASAGTHVHHAQRRACHAVILHATGRARSIVGCRERRHEIREGMVGCVPADGQSHTVVVSTDRRTSAIVFLIQPAMLADLADAEGVSGDLPEAFAFREPRVDEVLPRLRRLLDGGTAGGPEGRPEDALARHDLSRRLVLTVVERLTGRRPEWSADGSPFDRRSLAALVGMIDDSLRVPPHLADLARHTGLSPSHCGRKFRLSTGMSLSRFVNVRRVQSAVGQLREADVCLASLAIDLGFSSQSHFTRVFSACTGMSPARYRRGIVA